MQFFSVFLHITKDFNFWWENVDVIETQGVIHVIYIFFGSFLGKVWLRQVSSLWDMCGIFTTPPPIREQSQKDPSWISLKELRSENLNSSSSCFAKGSR